MLVKPLEDTVLYIWGHGFLYYLVQRRNLKLLRVYMIHLFLAHIQLGHHFSTKNMCLESCECKKENNCVDKSTKAGRCVFSFFFCRQLDFPFREREREIVSQVVHFPINAMLVLLVLVRWSSCCWWWWWCQEGGGGLRGGEAAADDDDNDDDYGGGASIACASFEGSDGGDENES